jgi:membrane protein
MPDPIQPPAPTAAGADPHRGVPHSMRKYVDRLQRSFPMAVINRFIEVDVLSQAAAVSFYALLSMAPLLVLLLWLTASLYPPAQQALVEQIGTAAGSSVATVAETVLQNADNQPNIGSLAGIWSTLLLFIGATAVFAQLQGALNLIFRTSGERLEGLSAWLRKRVFSFGVVLALGFLLVVSMTATTMLQVAFAQLPSLLPALGYISTLLLYTVAFAFMYHYLPDRRVAWRQAFIGGAITSALFALGRYGIGVYIAQVAPGSAYGSMGALVISLVWIYYAMVVFFIGALMTSVIDERLRAHHHLVAAGIAPPQPGATAAKG